mmetsp:Transcript_22384/g.46546  ORF Transcript_22384/g.46546 Transcript_22384/m.46546 type:complete len:110 (+) Transcript_22384:717-1046(+)
MNQALKELMLLMTVRTTCGTILLMSKFSMMELPTFWYQLTPKKSLVLNVQQVLGIMVAASVRGEAWQVSPEVESNDAYPVELYSNEDNTGVDELSHKGRGKHSGPLATP